MRKHLSSLCGGNWRGYVGTKEELDEMFAKCFEEASEYYISQSSLDNLKYDYERRDQIHPNAEGEYIIAYWSKW